jgi:hypothetical protein
MAKSVTFDRDTFDSYIYHHPFPMNTIEITIPGTCLKVFLSIPHRMILNTIT